VSANDVVPTVSVEAEQAVLGATLCDPGTLGRLADRRLQAEHFHGQANRLIWAAIVGLAARRLPIDALTVFDSLRDAGHGEACGGLAYINALQQAVPSIAGVTRHADTVLEKATRRAVLRAVDEAGELVRQPGDADEVLDRVASLFAAIQRTRAVSEPLPLAALVRDRIEHWTALDSGDRAPGISTGLPRLDEALGGGIKPGKVLVLAARPSVGKTSLATQILLNIASAGHPALMLSQEMQSGDLVDRMVANMGRVSLGHLTAGGFADDDWTRIADASESAAALPLFVDDQPALTLLDIRAKARQVQQRHGALAVVAIDYVQLCAGTGSHERRHHQIEQISRGMKTLAKDLQCCVLVLSQLNREAAKGEPELDALKESGAIEEDADTVILLHPMGNEADGSLSVLAKIPKNRQGRRGRFALSLHGATQRWTESSASTTPRR
jgi:replicative DNA helicase